MVSAENEWQESITACTLDLVAYMCTGFEDLVQEASSVGPTCACLGKWRLDVSAVLDLDSGVREPIPQTRVADRRRPHVNTAPARPEVERGPDDGDFGYAPSLTL
jgi:hypothetical protein